MKISNLLLLVCSLFALSLAYDEDSLVTCGSTTEYTACDISNGACYTKLSCTSIGYCIAMCSLVEIDTAATKSCFTSTEEDGDRQ